MHPQELRIDYILLEQQLDVLMEMVHYHEDYNFNESELEVLEGIENFVSEVLRFRPHNLTSKIAA